jgi:hypothetical protein
MLPLVLVAGCNPPSGQGNDMKVGGGGDLASGGSDAGDLAAGGGDLGGGGSDARRSASPPSTPTLLRARCRRPSR